MKLNLSRIQNGTFELYHNFGWGGGGRVLEIHILTYIFQSYKPHIFEFGLNSYVPQFLVCVWRKYKILIPCTRYSLFGYYLTLLNLKNKSYAFGRFLIKVRFQSTAFNYSIFACSRGHLVMFFFFFLFLGQKKQTNVKMHFFSEKILLSPNFQPVHCVHVNSAVYQTEKNTGALLRQQNTQ